MTWDLGNSVGLVSFGLIVGVVAYSVVASIWAAVRDGETDEWAPPEKEDGKEALRRVMQTGEWVSLVEANKALHAERDQLLEDIRADDEVSRERIAELEAANDRLHERLAGFGETGVLKVAELDLIQRLRTDRHDTNVELAQAKLALSKAWRVRDKLQEELDAIKRHVELVKESGKGITVDARDPRLGLVSPGFGDWMEAKPPAPHRVEPTFDPMRTQAPWRPGASGKNPATHGIDCSKDEQF